jgi:Glycosyltransferase family 10 (fucosyltransferase) C-term
MLLAPRQYEERPRFCNFIFSFPASVRAEFCLRLSRYKPVDGLGAVLNTTGSKVADKLKAMRDYRFAIAFENDLAHGYVTEKLFEALAAGCIPIYWGAREALSDFNADAFIFAPDFECLDALAQYVASVDRSPELQRKFLAAPIFPDNRIPYEHTPQFFADRVLSALSGTVRDEISDEWDVRLQKTLRPRKRRIIKSWDPRRAPWIKRLRRL